MKRPRRRSPPPGPSAGPPRHWPPSPAAAVVLLYLTDGPAAAGTGLAVTAVAALAAGRYVAGAGAHYGGYRKAVRLLGSRAPALGEWQRIVDRSLGDEGDLHFATALRPQLQRLFAARLAERHGVALRRDPERARALVGPGLWPWIDPAQPPPEPQPSESVLRELLDRLESL